MKFSEDTNVTDVIKYSNADHAFAAFVINDIKRNQRLPLAIRSEDVFNAIRNETMYWYEHKPDATIEDQLIFGTDVFEKQKRYLADNKDFELFTNAILFPTRVLAVYEAFYDTQRAFVGAGISWSRWQLESILLSNFTSAPYNFGVDNYLGSLFCTNLLRSVSKEPVLYEYNRLTNIFQVFDMGNSRWGSIYCKIARAIPLENLYRDIWYRKFIMSKVIEARADQIELYGAQLPGDTQVNTQVLKNRASTLMEEVNKQLQAEEDADFYVIKS